MDTLDNKKKILSRFRKTDEVLALLFPEDKVTLYVAGGIGCMLIDASIRPTMDFDFIDQGLSAKYLRVLNTLGDIDFIDISVTAMADDFQERAVLSYRGSSLSVYTVSAEDIIVMKLNRYNGRDSEDITKLLRLCDVTILLNLIEKAGKSLSNEVSKKIYEDNVKKFMETLKDV